MIGYSQDLIDDEMGHLTINGVVVENSVALRRKGYVTAAVEDKDVVEQLIAHRFTDLPDDLHDLSLLVLFDDFDQHIKSGIQSIKSTDSSQKVVFNFTYKLTDWNRPWTCIEYINQYRKSMREFLPETYVDDRVHNGQKSGFYVVFTVRDTNKIIAETMNSYYFALEQSHQRTVVKLVETIGSKSIAMAFDFPDSVKTYCEQYLLYFVQFLRDVGVEATAELKEHAGRVLFSITPKDENEALDNIREALELYLYLPSNVGLNTSSPMNADLATQQLAATVYHFKSQLMLQAATIQQKDMLIQQQQNFIQQLSTGTVIVDSAVRGSDDEEDKEPVVGNLVKVTKWKWEFIEADFPTMIRYVKGLFRRRK